jgi:hypothetical protein
MGMVYFLAKFCMTPVKKAWVKKNPDSQKVGGLPSSYHFCRDIQVYVNRIEKKATIFDKDYISIIQTLYKNILFNVK